MDVLMMGTNNSIRYKFQCRNKINYGNDNNCNSSQFSRQFEVVFFRSNIFLGVAALLTDSDKATLPGEVQGSRATLSYRHLGPLGVQFDPHTIRHKPVRLVPASILHVCCNVLFNYNPQTIITIYEMSLIPKSLCIMLIQKVYSCSSLTRLAGQTTSNLFKILTQQKYLFLFKNLGQWRLRAQVTHD